MMLDELVDLDEERMVASKTFVVGDYSWKVILHMDRKDRTLSKWSSNWECL